MKGSCWENLSSALPVMHAASCSHSEKQFQACLLNALYSVFANMSLSLPTQWVDEYTLFVLDWTRGLSRDHPEYQPIQIIQQASCSRLRASHCQSGRVRAQEATDKVYSSILMIGVQTSLTLCWKDSELLEYLYILTLLVLSLQFLPECRWNIDIIARNWSFSGALPWRFDSNLGQDTISPPKELVPTNLEIRK